MKKTNRILALFVAVIIMFAQTVPAFAQDSNTIIISSAEQFISFANNCSLDTWSEGKTVVLQQDIDLKESNFQCIPIFSGTFDGAGHNIVGINLTQSGSTQGLFRYLKEGGVVKNVTVVGTVAPGGTKCSVGGIVGNNSGSIINCTFAGIVSGDTTVGGIVGLNNEEGNISNCKTRGTVNGKKNTGGICGKNLGVISKCIGNCNINTTSTETKITIDDIEVDLNTTINSIKNQSGFEEEDDITLSSHTDTGGIAGYSSGIIQGCENIGTIGYQHMGYNVGGIVGRQSGYVVSCTNNGVVYGRKDVGGIAGQTEPYIIMNLSSDILSQLQGELDKLQNIINSSLDDASTTSDKISGHLTSISSLADFAKDDAKSLFDQTTDFVDSNIGEVNDIGVTVSDTLDKMTGVLDDAESSSETITKALRQLKKALSTMEDTSGKTTDAIESAKETVDELIKTSDDIKSAISGIKDALKVLGDSITADGVSMDSVIEAIKNLVGGGASSMRQLAKALNTAREEIDRLREDLANISDLGDLIGSTDKEEFLKSLEEIAKAFGEMNDSLTASADELSKILGDVNIDEDKFKTAISMFLESFDDFKNAMGNGERALKKLKNTLKYTVDVSEGLEKAFSQLEDATGTISKASGYLTDAVSGFRDLVEDLANEEPIKFTKLGDDFRTVSESLYTYLNGISDEVTNLNDTVTSSSKDFINNIRSINNQFNNVMNTVINAVEDLQNGDDGGEISDLIQDTSEENINATKLGKIADCTNNGEVNADKNVGGISGSMDIEYDLDPEDDFDSSNIFRTSYETKAVLQNCLNNGIITGKKDGIGGIVGRMDLGTVTQCQNYGNIESTGGDYVGGIAGTAESKIMNSYSKCILKGESYIGGIAGNGSKIESCCAIVTIENGEECLGAIAGKVSGKNSIKDGNIFNNYFVSEDMGGIDGISYSTNAEPISFEKMSSLNGIPSKFLSFTITFVANGETITEIPVKYGEKLYEAELPEIPKKDGYYGKWPDTATEEVIESSTVEAEYVKWVEVVASEETEQDGKKSLALAEGNFTDEAVLHVTNSELKAPEEAKNYDVSKVLNISLTGTDLKDTAVVPIRVLSEGGSKAKAWQLKDNQWIEVDTQINGNYIKLKMDGTEGVICIASKGSEFNIKYVIGLSLMGAAFVVYVIDTTKKKVKKLKKDNIK